MAVKVNLDALIPREDFEINEGGITSQFGQTLQIRDLEKASFFYPVIRKPDFQRETGDWTPERVVNFIESYIDGDLIPAIILWQSGNNIFVIDGCHRLSALIAWVHDDYGDGDISRVFFEQKISDEQKQIAEQTRALVKKSVGSYKDFQHAIQYPDRSEKTHVDRARKLGFLALQLQWVKGDADKAEESFFKINQHAAPIDPTELRVLKSRHKPNAIAARAIIRAGTGHKYWSKFDAATQVDIETISADIYKLLFVPTLKTPIKTLDLPIAGKGYSSNTLLLLLDFLNLANGLSNESKLDNDADGQATLRYLKNAKKIASRVTGVSSGSLGLHPIVYFYSAAGRYQPTAFLAVVTFVVWLDSRNKFDEFTRHRAKLEKFLLEYKSIPSQMALKLGSGTKGGAKRLAELYQFVIEQLELGADYSSLPNLLLDNARFSFLTYDKGFVEGSDVNFSTGAKSAVFVKEALANPVRCGICEGLMHMASITIDHVTRKQDGGLGTSSNGQVSHPYCNTTFKN